MAVLVVIALSWVGWVAYQLQPRTVVIEQALREAEAQAEGADVPEAAPITPVVAAPAAAEPPAPPPSAPQTASAPPAVEQPPKVVPEPAETFKLARSIETPIPQSKPKPATTIAAGPKAPAEPAVKAVVDKRAKAVVNEAAEAHFRRAAALLNQGRVSEAEDHLIAALHADPSHLAARQAYVELLIEQRRIDAALPALRDAVSRHPTQGAFVLALARLHAERRDYSASLEVMEKFPATAQGADFQALRGAVLQRLGRHAEAASAYQLAVQGAPHSGSAWAGLGISLEALGRNAEAARAYHRAIGSGNLAKELREYAEARIQALE
jgi:MSHA biogenesis protein MshN